jgi:hypothetical protein
VEVPNRFERVEIDSVDLAAGGVDSCQLPLVLADPRVSVARGTVLAVGVEFVVVGVGVAAAVVAPAAASASEADQLAFGGAEGGLALFLSLFRVSGRGLLRSMMLDQSDCP